MGKIKDAIDEGRQEGNRGGLLLVTIDGKLLMEFQTKLGRDLRWILLKSRDLVSIPG